MSIGWMTKDLPKALRPEDLTFSSSPLPLLPWRIANRKQNDEEMTTFLSLREVNPIHNIRVHSNNFAVKTARLPLQEAELEVPGNTTATVLVPAVSLHEVLLVEYQD